MPDLRTFIGTTNWGKDLNGGLVSSKVLFFNAIASLRTTNGRSFSYPWNTPVKWAQIFKYMNTVSGVHGSDDDTISKLRGLGISLLAVEGIDCGGTTLKFTTTDSSSSTYWKERWELYKQSYAMAVYSYNKGIRMIEFFNEPDLNLGTCLDVNEFKDFYMIRSLSIQHAYEDLNKENSADTKISVQVVASAFARKTFGGDTTRYLGDVVIQNKNYLFGDSTTKVSNWTNIHL